MNKVYNQKINSRIIQYPLLINKFLFTFDRT